MFEFSIKSSKNVKSFSIVFDDDGETIQTIETKANETKANETKANESRERDFTSYTKQVDNVSQPIGKPSIPEVSTISIADELQNLSL